MVLKRVMGVNVIYLRLLFCVMSWIYKFKRGSSSKKFFFMEVYFEIMKVAIGFIENW